MGCTYCKVNGCTEEVCPYADRTKCALYLKSHSSYLLKAIMPFQFKKSLVVNHNEQVFVTDDCSLAKSFCAYHALKTNQRITSLTLDTIVAVLQEQYDDVGAFPRSSIYYLDLFNTTEKQLCWISSFVNIVRDTLPSTKIGIWGNYRIATKLGVPLTQLVSPIGQQPMMAIHQDENGTFTDF